MFWRFYCHLRYYSAEPEASAKVGAKYDLPDEIEEPEASAKAGNEMSESAPRPTGFIKPIQCDLKPEDITEIYDESKTNALLKGSQQYRTVWDTYSTNYYYNMLTQSEKNLWDKLDDMCYGYLVGTESLTSRDSYDNETSGKTTYYFDTKAVPYEAGLTRARVFAVMRLFYYSNPQYYFLEVVTKAGFGYAQMSVNASFANGEENTRYDLRKGDLRSLLPEHFVKSI